MKDELQARFTVWIEKVIYSAKIDYIRQSAKEPKEISLEEVTRQTEIAYIQDIRLEDYDISKGEYAFENERIELAFSTLSKVARQVLLLLYIFDMTPDEVAFELGCSVQNIYKVRAHAIANLREMLKNERE